MILRYYLTCANCHKVILFRVGVSNEDREPFSFECENCSQPISGTLVLDQKNVEIEELELNGADFADSQDWDQAFDYEVNYHPAFAHEDIHVDGTFVSPFLQAMRSHGEDALELVNTLGLLSYVERQVWGDAKRIVRNYVAE